MSGSQSRIKRACASRCLSFRSGTTRCPSSVASNRCFFISAAHLDAVDRDELRPWRRGRDTRDENALSKSAHKPLCEGIAPRLPHLLDLPLIFLPAFDRADCWPDLAENSAPQCLQLRWKSGGG
jgi:hypothetical protein